MSRTALVAWGVALLLVVAIGAEIVHARSARVHACRHVGGPVSSAPLYPVKACAQARTREDTMLLMGGLAALVIVMGTLVAIALRR